MKKIRREQAKAGVERFRDRGRTRYAEFDFEKAIAAGLASLEWIHHGCEKLAKLFSPAGIEAGLVVRDIRYISM
jgi:hypothetical protein